MTDSQARALQKQIDQLQAQVRTLGWIIAIVVFWVIARDVFGGTLSDAWEDRRKQPEQRQPFTWYFTTDHLPPERRKEAVQTLQYVICSTSSVVPIDRQRLREVRPGLYAVDVGHLRWGKEPWSKILKAYPYRTDKTKNYLVLRADWFITFVTNQKVSNSVYFELIFGRDVKNLDDFYSLTKTDVKSELTFGRIVDESGVAIPRNGGSRLVKVFPTSRRLDMWSTYDSQIVNAAGDPLEQLDLKNFQYDAQEHIGGLVKSWTGRDGRRYSGHMQLFALTNAAGEIQEVAPIDIVHDSTSTGPELINPRSCMSCHEGYKKLEVDGLRRFVQSGAEAYSPKADELDDFYLGGVDGLLDTANRGYAHALLAVNRLTPEQQSQAFQSVVYNYERKLSAEDAARELGINEKGLALALAAWNNAGNKLTARSAQLAHGVGISRVRFEEDYPNLALAVYFYRQSQKQVLGGKAQPSRPNQN